jgi:hypothetical protein
VPQPLLRELKEIGGKRDKFGSAYDRAAFGLQAGFGFTQIATNFRVTRGSPPAELEDGLGDVSERR